MRFAFIAVVAFFSTAARLQATLVVLDQHNNFDSSIADSTSGNVAELAQTFKVGIAGILDHIEVLMFREDGIYDPTAGPILSLYSTTGGIPTGTPLFTITIPESDVPLDNEDYVSFDVSSAAIPVNVGDVLAFSISTTSPTGPYFLPKDGGGYTGGTSVIRYLPSGAWTSQPSADYGFNTYVSVAVPETSSLLFLLTAVVTSATLRFRRRNAAS